MEVPSSANVNIYECISSMGATANPLKKRSFRCVLKYFDSILGWLG